MDEFFECAGIYDDRDRIECYDQLAGSLVEDAPAGVRGVGRWEVSIETDEDNNTIAVSLTGAAESDKTQSEESITVVMRCRNGDTDLYINWQDYLGNEASVQTQIGDQGAVTQNWNLSASHQSSFYPDDSTEFITQLLNADLLVAQVSPYRARPVRATFNLTGLSDAIVPLRQTCNW